MVASIEAAPPARAVAAAARAGVFVVISVVVTIISIVVTIWDLFGIYVGNVYGIC